MKQYEIIGANASAIAASAEQAILSGSLEPGARLPTVRGLARRLGVSPATVAAAYQSLRLRGLIIGAGRSGTTVVETSQVSGRPPPPIPSGARNLADGRPDPDLLPKLAQLLSRVGAAPHYYGAPYNRTDLCELAAASFRGDGIPTGPIAIFSGALDALERLLGAHLRIGDSIVVEDPGYPPILDLIAALGLRAQPCPLDDRGLLPEGLAAALKAGASALVLTPRAQNPTGAALDRKRAGELRKVLREWPHVFVLEDDHAGPIAGAPAVTLCETGRRRWAIVRSMSKALGPDLRVALVTGDALTIERIEGRQRLGAGWVSHILQELTVRTWSDPSTPTLLERAAAEYGLRRKSLIEALARHGIEAHGRSGLNVWILVRDELSVMHAMLDAGWALSAGERYRLKSGPGVRVSIARLQPSEAERLAADFAHSLGRQRQMHYA